MKVNCSRCGREVELQGIISRPDAKPKDIYLICDVCKKEMPKSTITIKIYDDGKFKWTDVAGECEICKASPCEHSWELRQKLGEKLANKVGIP